MTNSLSIIGLSLIIWILEGLALYLMCRSVGISVVGADLLLLLFLSSMSTLVPSAPGYVGTYQLAFVIAFSMFASGPEGAIVASTLQQVINIGGGSALGLLIFAVGLPKAVDTITVRSKGSKR